MSDIVPKGIPGLGACAQRRAAVIVVITPTIGTIGRVVPAHSGCLV